MKNLISQGLKLCLSLSLIILIFTPLGAQLTAELNEDVSGFGGELRLNEENGLRYMFFQPDFNGSGGFFQIQDGNNSPFFRVEGNASGNNGQVDISGNSNTVFNTSQLGNLSVILPTDAVNSTEIENEVGTANAFNGGGITLTGAYQTILSQTITAPTNGFVLAIATAEIAWNKTASTTNLWSRCGISTDSTSLGAAMDITAGVPSSAADGFYYFPYSASGIFQVSAGTNTFYFIGEELSGDGCRVWDSNLTLLFIPTSYGTVSSNIIDPSSSARAGTINGSNSDAVFTGSTIEETKAITEQSILDNQRRIEKEMADLKALIKEMKVNSDKQGLE